MRSASMSMGTPNHRWDGSDSEGYPSLSLPRAAQEPEPTI